MKNQFKVINLGLNEFGVQEFNNHFKTNIRKELYGFISLYKL